VISFVIFFLFFICLLWWVFTTDKKVIDRMKEMPLDLNTDRDRIITNNQKDAHP
jgi:cbb3-type cytochrome oxidase subunit 3